MDNDTLRRGRPTLHVVYGDGIAILAGDGLQAEAFALLAREPVGDDPALVARKLRVAAGRSARRPAPTGMVGGQAIDLQAAGQAPGHAVTLDADGLRAMHARKTGALIRASAVSGAIMARRRRRTRSTRSIAYAAELGLAFQIVDDILDVEGSAGELGKTAGKDAAGAKPTYPALFGLERSRALAAECVDARADARRRRLDRRLARPSPTGWSRGRIDAELRSRGTTDTNSTSRGRDLVSPCAVMRHAVTLVTMRKIRLDVALVERGLAPSRERARALILAGQVTVDGQVVSKAGAAVGRRRSVELVAPDHPYVGRGGVKLAHALDAFAIDVAGRRALDVGASTGGFTDVLLQRGAASVIALDVGRGQLDWRLRTDPRVVVREGVNARALTDRDVPHAVDLVTIDVVVHLAAAHLPGAAAVPRAGRRRRRAGEAAVRGRARRGRQARPRHRPGGPRGGDRPRHRRGGRRAACHASA